MRRQRSRATPVCRRVGLAGSVLFAGLSAGEVVRGVGDEGGLFEDPTGGLMVLVYLSAALLFLASSRYPVLRMTQPGVLLAMVPVQAFFGSGALYALGFALAAVILLAKFGYLVGQGKSSVAALALCVGISELGAGFGGHDPRVVMYASVFCLVVSCAVVGTRSSRRLPEPNRERNRELEPAPKELLILKRYHLTRCERECVRLRLAGKAPKEIAVLRKVSDSTIRNTLAGAYRKLGISRAAELAALGERYYIQ